MYKKTIMVTLSLLMGMTFTACGGTDEETTSVTGSETDNNQSNEDKTLPEEPLQKGEQGENVERLQQALEQLSYPVEITGQFDEITTWALTDFQFQTDDLYITGQYDEETKQALESQLDSDNTIQPGEGIPLEEDKQTEDGIPVTSNPYDMLVLVNKENALPEDFIPDDLVVPDVRFPFTEDLPKKEMRKVAADHMEEMFAAADKEGLELFAQSGYRSFERQVDIFAANVEKNGEEAANKYSARPGESEHQTGLTMDVTNADVGFDVIIEFGETPEGKWLKDHASDYGFIIRFPEGKEDITGYQYEPWHIRYVGEEAAQEIMDNDITLEEYLDNEMSFE